MSVTSVPTASSISANISPSSLTNSIASPTLSSFISSNAASLIPSITSNTISSTTLCPAIETSNSNPNGIPGINLDFSGQNAKQYLESARHAYNIGSQFTICIVTGLLFFLAFCIFRTRIPVLFAPRLNMKRHKPPELPASLFGWILPLLKIGDEEMLTNVGLDALLMLKFITMGIKIFSVCTIFGLTVFFPITMTSDYSHIENITVLDRVSITVIAEGSNKIIAYLVFAYIFTFITFFFLNQHYNEYIYLRAKYLLKQSKNIVSRSIIVTGIPNHLKSDQALADYYENLGVGPVESCYVVRTVHRLNTMIKKRAQALICLEEAYAKYWGNPCRIPGYDPDRILDDVDMYRKVLDLAEKRPDSSSDEEEEMKAAAAEGTEAASGTNSQFRKRRRTKNRPGNTTFFKGLVEPKLGIKKTMKSKRPTVRIGGLFGLFGQKVDAIEYYTKLFDDLDKTVIEQRRSPSFEMTNVAFITFEQMSSAVIASQIAITPEPFMCRTSMACEPRDVLWSALAIRGRERIIREAIVWTITILLCLTWFIPVGAISSLLSIETIKNLNYTLGLELEGNDIATLIFGSFIPPIVLNIFTSILPLFFDTLGYYQGLRSRSAIAESTLSKQYFFLIFLTLIFYSVVGTTAMTILTDFANDPKKIPEVLANVFPTLAPFFINYTILQGFLIMPLNLLLLGAIILRGFYHLFICSTPREHAENRAPWAFNYGIGYPAPLLVFAIVFEYSLISPLILLFGTMYFCFTYVVYKYQFLYVYFRPYEAAGKLWTMVIPRIIFTLVLFQLTMMGLFLLQKEYILSGLVLPLIFLTFLFRYLLNRAYRQNGQNLPMQLLRDNQDKLVLSSDEEDETSGDESDDDSSCDEQPTATSKNHSFTSIADNDNTTKTDEVNESRTQEIKNRWKKAAFTATNLKEPESVAEEKTAKATLVRLRHRKLVLDEDDYEAKPDRLTDYRQPPMQLNPGLLDAGLKKYGNPLLVGVLPQLWLPVKMPVAGEDKSAENRSRKSDLLHNRISGGGGHLAQHLAEILRKMERDHQDEIRSSAAELSTSTSNNRSVEVAPVNDDLIEKSRITAEQNAATIVEGRRRRRSTATHPKILALRGLFKRGELTEANVQNTASGAITSQTPDASLDSMERGGDQASVRSASSKYVHKVYYHHPERQRHHSDLSHNSLAPLRQSRLGTSNLSSPAVFPAPSDEELAAQTIERPDTSNSRQSSDPLIKKRHQ